VLFEDAVYVLHAFQKKSRKGIPKPQKEMDLMYQCLAYAERDHKEARVEPGPYPAAYTISLLSERDRSVVE
jgi:hypothetical protein